MTRPRSTSPCRVAVSKAPRRLLLILAAAAALVPIAARAAISTTGNVSPPYPGGGLDPWNVGAELQVGNVANGTLTIDAGSEVTSTGGMAGNAASVTGDIVVTGSGSTWSNTGDLLLGVSGDGTLDVLLGAEVTNSAASLGHLSGSGTVTVQGAGSEWTSSDELIIGNNGDGHLTIGQQGKVITGAARIGVNGGATGTVVVDGAGSTWEVFQSISLGNGEPGSIATLSLTGSGSRVYVGASAIMFGTQLPAAETAVVVSEALGLGQLAIHGGNQLNNGGSGYIAPGVNQHGMVTVQGIGSAWNNAGDLSIGAGGEGTLTLVDGGTSSAGGQIAIGNLGRVTGNGTLSGSTTNSGVIAPGASVGRIDVVGGFTQSAAGNLQIDVAGATADQYDQLTATSSVALNGTLDVTLDDAYDPAIGAKFDIVSASGIAGRFSAAELPALPAGRMWHLRYLADKVQLAVTLAGDYNDNGSVDAADYVIWRNLQGATFDPQADGDTNGVVNAIDLSIWRANYGALAGSGVANIQSTTGIPEPTTTVLLLSAGAYLAIRPRRRVDLPAIRTLACWRH